MLKTIEYRGQQVGLVQDYEDYLDYKKDENSIAPSEIPRVEALICEAPIAPLFASREEVIRAGFSLKFPGFGAATLGDGHVGEHSLTGFAIEIPRTGKGRYISTDAKAGNTPS